MELAIRKILPSIDCYPVESQVPTLYFKRDQHWETLRLEMGSYQRSGFVDYECYTAGVETTWVLSSLGADRNSPEEESDVANQGRPFGRISFRCPSAVDLWRVAAASDRRAINRMKSKLPTCDLGVAND